MAAPKRRGLSYRLLCNVMTKTSGGEATYVIAKKLGVPRSVAKRALEDLQRKGLVTKHVADRSGGSGPNYSAARMDLIDGSKKKVFIWDVVLTGKAGQRIAQRCELPSQGARYRISSKPPRRTADAVGVNWTFAPRDRR